MVRRAHPTDRIKYQIAMVGCAARHKNLPNGTGDSDSTNRYRYCRRYHHSVSFFTQWRTRIWGSTRLCLPVRAIKLPVV